MAEPQKKPGLLSSEGLLWLSESRSSPKDNSYMAALLFEMELDILKELPGGLKGVPLASVKDVRKALEQGRKEFDNKARDFFKGAKPEDMEEFLELQKSVRKIVDKQYIAAIEDGRQPDAKAIQVGLEKLSGGKLKIYPSFDVEEKKKVDPAASQGTAKEAAVTRRNLEIADRDTFVAATVDKAPDAFPDREARKAFLARLGVDNMKENDRMIIYRDETQTLLFRGTVDEKGNVVLKESLDLTSKEKGKTPGTLEDMIKKITTDDLKFKPMKQPITVPKERNEETDKKLKAEVTLFALANKAISDTQIASASNAALPKNVNTSKQAQI